MRSSRQNPLARKVPLAEYAMKLAGVVSFVRQLAPAIHCSFEERFSEATDIAVYSILLKHYMFFSETRGLTLV